MKVRIVVSYVPRYRGGHRWHFVPPITGLHLAALTPAEHEVEVVHEQVRPVPVDARPDLVALTFFSGFARRAYEVADAYRRLGVRVVAGGPHASYWPDEALEHVDAVVVGEAEGVWPRLLEDAAGGRLERLYRGQALPLEGLPTPRYDLLEDSFVVRRVVQGTRGCPFSCSFCTVPDLNPGFRTRPVGDVVRDVAESRFDRWWQDKVVWFWDDNLLAPRRWAKELLYAMAPLHKWWLTQASIDIVKDRALLDAMERSGCVGIFLGIESLDPRDLALARKRQNRASEYADAVRRLHDRGICVMAGFISGFDGQDPERIVRTAEGLDAIGVDVPFLSVLTPFRGTPLYDELLAEGRLLEDRDWPFYNGYNVTFRPAGMSPEALHDAHRALWRAAFAPRAVAARLARGARTLSPGGMMLSSAMNGFYGLKRLEGREPADAVPTGARIAHPPPRTRSTLTPVLTRGRPSLSVLGRHQRSLRALVRENGWAYPEREPLERPSRGARPARGGLSPGAAQPPLSCQPSAQVGVMLARPLWPLSFFEGRPRERRTPTRESLSLCQRGKVTCTFAVFARFWPSRPVRSSQRARMRGRSAPLKSQAIAKGCGSARPGVLRRNSPKRTPRATARVFSCASRAAGLTCSSRPPTGEPVSVRSSARQSSRRRLWRSRRSTRVSQRGVTQRLQMAKKKRGAARRLARAAPWHALGPMGAMWFRRSALNALVRQ